MAQRYIIREAKKVYSDQWQSLNDKHMEIIVKQEHVSIYFPLHRFLMKMNV
jgi:hypothetical protein